MEQAGDELALFEGVGEVGARGAAAQFCEDVFGLLGVGLEDFYEEDFA